MATGGKPRPRHRASFPVPSPFAPPTIGLGNLAEELVGTEPYPQANRIAKTPSSEALQQLLAFAALYQYTRNKPTIIVHNEVQDERAAGVVVPSDAPPFAFDEVLQLVLQRAEAITGANGVAIALAESDGIVLRAAMGAIRPDVGTRIEPDSAFSGSCLRTAQTITCGDTETDSRVNLEVCRDLGARSIAAVPISGHQGVIGLLELFSGSPDAFSNAEIQSVGRLAEVIASALAPKEHNLLAQFARDAANKLVSASTSCETATSDNVNTLQTAEEGTAPRADRSNASRQIAAAVLVIVIGSSIALGVWVKGRSGTSRDSERVSAEKAASSSTPRVSESAKPPATIASVRRPASSTLATSRAISADVAQLPRVTGLENTSATNSSTVTVDLEGAVHYQAHRLTSPDRIYVDLSNTQLAASLSSGKRIEVDDSQIKSMRIAQPVPGTTRVALETLGAPYFSVNLETNPYRLVIEVRADTANH